MDKTELISAVTRAQNGDSDAISDLYNAFYNSVYYFAKKTVKDDDLTLDITQETFMEVIRNINSLKAPEAFSSWLRQITYYQCTRYFKKNKEVLFEEDEEGNTILDTIADNSEDSIPEEVYEKAEFKEIILSMIDKLTPEQRAVVILYYYDEMSVKKIAEIQGVSEGTVKSRLNYARRALRDGVEAYEKKTGTKLHAIPFIPLFRIFLGESATLGASEAAAIGEAVSVAAGSTLATTAAATTAATVTVATATTATTAAAAVTVPIAAKIAAVALAIAVTVGAGTAIVKKASGTPAETNAPVVEITETEDTDIESSVVDTDIPETDAPETITPETDVPAIDPFTCIFSYTEPTLSIEDNILWVRIPHPAWKTTQTAACAYSVELYIDNEHIQTSTSHGGIVGSWVGDGADLAALSTAGRHTATVKIYCIADDSVSPFNHSDDTSPITVSIEYFWDGIGEILEVEPSLEETSAETLSPETDAPETLPPETSIPETDAPETTAETDVPEEDIEDIFDPYDRLCVFIFGGNSCTSTLANDVLTLEFTNPAWEVLHTATCAYTIDIYIDDELFLTQTHDEGFVGPTSIYVIDFTPYDISGEHTVTIDLHCISDKESSPYFHPWSDIDLPPRSFVYYFKYYTTPVIETSSEEIPEN